MVLTYHGQIGVQGLREAVCRIIMRRPDLNAAALGLQSNGGIDHQSLRSTDSKVRMEEHHSHHPAHRTAGSNVMWSSLNRRQQQQQQPSGGKNYNDDSIFLCSFGGNINVCFEMCLQRWLHTMEEGLTTDWFDFWHIPNWEEDLRLYASSFIFLYVMSVLKVLSKRVPSKYYRGRINNTRYWEVGFSSVSQIAVMRMTCFLKREASMN